jgi:Domain of unknown function (DUF5664)
MSIDFSKAPEGATHYYKSRTVPGEMMWYSVHAGVAAFWTKRGWEVGDVNAASQQLKLIPFVSVEDAQLDELVAAGVIQEKDYIDEKRERLKPTGSKHDAGKPLMGAVPPNALLTVAKVLTFGAEKYGRDNWRQVENAETRYMDAALRHLNAYQRGGVVDPESGESHLAHAVCSLMFLLELQS